MKIKTIAATMAILFSSFNTSASTEEAINPAIHSADILNIDQANTAAAQGFITGALIRGWILDGAKSAIKGGAKDFISNLLFGGGPAGPQIVRLHSEDLEKIESLVSGVVINDAVYDAKSDLAAFSTTFDYYQDSLNSSQFDASILTSLLTYVNSLRHHRAYEASYNTKAFALTSSYSTMAALNIAVLTERHVKGFISAAYVKNQGNLMATKLEELGSLASSHAYTLGYVRSIGSRCWGGEFSNLESNLYQEQNLNSITIEIDEDSPMAPVDCLVTASFPGKPSKTWNASRIGRMEAEEMAFEYLNRMSNEYAAEIKGSDFNSVIAKLRGL
ncbi:hypothetical protein J8L98_01545 [Pseudoalteromonas sp. MMG013]|uniref:hypothetical protein n=1 Tax=Pseudoalteromonas sp. MMG013 TaxID=2822687 RepID=UPI001B386159|nr:hypothetical protein [Pseudoalteromonas sp. MMG013]MBQ4860373.1 hypothetical protein [Pseudoalteromonas sp. MMG013]